jgi:hypothetical protein
MHDSFTLPEGLLELKEVLEETWPAISAEIRESGVPTNEVPEEPAVDDPAAADLAAGAGAGAAADAGEEPAEPAAAAPEPAAAPQFDPLEFEALQQRMVAYEAEREQLIAALRGQAAGAGGEPAPAATELQYDEFGQVTPESLLAAMRQTAIEAAQAANRPLLDQITQAQAEQAASQREEHYSELVEDMIASNIARNGDLASTPAAQETAIGLLEARAMQLLPSLNEKYGRNPDGSARPGVLERAIEQAASELRAYSGLTGEAALTQERNRLGELAGAGAEPGPGGGGAHEAPVIRLGETSASKFAAARQ